MAWCRPGNKPLSEPMVVSLVTNICVTRPQWVNGLSAIRQKYRLIVGPFGTASVKDEPNLKVFLQQMSFKYVVGKMPAIMFWTYICLFISHYLHRCCFHCLVPTDSIFTDMWCYLQLFDRQLVRYFDETNSWIPNIHWFIFRYYIMVYHIMLRYVILPYHIVLYYVILYT